FKLERQSSAPAPLFGRDWILLGSSLNRLIHIIKNPNGHRAANVIGIILGIARHKAKRRRQPVDNEQSAGNVGSKKLEFAGHLPVVALSGRTERSSARRSQPAN